MEAAHVGFSESNSGTSILDQMLANFPKQEPDPNFKFDYEAFLKLCPVDPDFCFADRTPEQEHDASERNAIFAGREFAFSEPTGPTDGWEDRLYEMAGWDIEIGYEDLAEFAAKFHWERIQGVEKVGFEIDIVKGHASGRWAEILTRLGGLTTGQVDGSQQPCPKCGGNDRFRVFGDFDESGGMFCNQCFSFRNGDGFSALQWLTGKSFAEVLADVANFLEMPPGLRRDHHYDLITNKSTWADGVDRSKEENAWLTKQRAIYAKEPPQLAIMPGDMLLEDYDQMPEQTISGVLRRGEVAVINAPTKMKKTYLALGLAVSVSHGDPWLSFDVQQGRVLYIDNELMRPGMSRRYADVLSKSQKHHSQIDGISQLDFVSLRGNYVDVIALGELLINTVKERGYSLIIFDALYQMLPEDCEENSNPDMTKVVRHLIQIAKLLNVSIVVIHHTSKGEQGDKNVRDVGSGAGSINRAPDTVIAFRQHEQPNCAVLEALTRSFKDPEPITIKFEFPLWYATTLEPALKQRKTAMELKKENRDKEADAEILALVGQHGPVSRRAMRTHTDMGRERIESALARLKKAGTITMREEGKTQVYEAVPAH